MQGSHPVALALHCTASAQVLPGFSRTRCSLVHCAERPDAVDGALVLLQDVERSQFRGIVVDGQSRAEQRRPKTPKELARSG